jgi:hypothetical protein
MIVCASINQLEGKIPHIYHIGIKNLKKLHNYFPFETSIYLFYSREYFVT